MNVTVGGENTELKLYSHIDSNKLISGWHKFCFTFGMHTKVLFYEINLPKSVITLTLTLAQSLSQSIPHNIS